MKKFLLKNIAFIVFGVVLALGSSAFAGIFNPTSPPPTGNLDPVVTNLSVAQVKTGSLSVGGFSAAQDAQLQQQVFFGDIVRGGGVADQHSTLKIGGTEGTSTYNVTVFLQGSTMVTGEVGSDSLINASNRAVCADDHGKIILCP